MKHSPERSDELLATPMITLQLCPEVKESGSLQPKGEVIIFPGRQCWEVQVLDPGGGNLKRSKG